MLESQTFPVVLDLIPHKYVSTLEITFETDRAQKYSLSSEIQPLQVEEVAQNGVLDRRISADFRQISVQKEGQALADCLDIVVGCRTHHVLNGCAIYDSLERSDSSISAKSSKTRDHPPLDLVLRSPHSFTTWISSNLRQSATFETLYLRAQMEFEGMVHKKINLFYTPNKLRASVGI